MSDLKLAAMAILIVIVAPIIVGYAWPVGTETVDTWTTDNSVDITPSIATSDIPIVDSYSGPMNHYWLYYDGLGYSAYSPVGYTASPSSIPKMTYTSASESITENLSIVDFRSHTAVRTDFITTVNLAVDMVDGETHYCSAAIYMPSSNTVYIMGMGYVGEALKASEVDKIRVTGATASNPVLLTTRTYTVVEGQYVDMSEGFELNGQNLQWYNGMENHVVEMWLESASIGSVTLTAGGYTTIISHLGSGGIYVSGEMLGTADAYPFISVTFDHDSGTVEVRGLLGADSFTDSTWTTGNAVTLDYQLSLMDSITMSGQANYEVKRTYSEIGTGKGISDATIVPYSYYPHNSWQISFDAPARFGESITVGQTTLPVEKGGVTFIDLNGEERTVAIRDMAILSLVYEDENAVSWQHIYINGYEFYVDSPSTSFSVSLDGDWYVRATVSDVVQGEQTSYVWEIGSFGLDRTNYCLVGLIVSVLTMIGAGLWGRASGSKLMTVMICTGLIAIGYLVLMQ